ncbi:MAG TPA: PhzF family phenazine biosynthesis protein [Candidatus Limnocylindria bacterium]|nr:PhzF family phenazine biosynthesis protein [Candidatus Limnocylindria bacterium]
MTRHEYQLVDVFTDRPFGGNPLAVFADARGIDERLMQPIAKELHLSETSFVLPPTTKAADHRLRIFTSDTELPFAGHPTVGTAYVLAAGRDGTMWFEEGVGNIRVTLRDGFVQMEQPVPSFTGTMVTRRAAAEALSLAVEEVRSDVPIQVVSAGVPFLLVPLQGLKAVRHARRGSGELDANVYVFAMGGEWPDSHVHGRMFDQGLGTGEDPATGSANGPLGAYLVAHELVPAEPTVRIRSEQGFEMGRPSIMDIEIDRAGDRITGVRVGGRCVPMGGGWLDI